MKITKIESRQHDYFHGHIVTVITIYLIYVDGFSRPFVCYDRPDFQVGYKLTRDDIYYLGINWVNARKSEPEY